MPGEMIELEPLGSKFKRAPGNVHTNGLELRFGKEMAK